jgi:inorganic pyrophosphatase
MVIADLPARPPGSKLVHVVIDTPKGSRNKYKLDAALGCFRLSRILPAGAAFPFNFGFIPGTRAEDGDALDVMVVMDDPVPVGVLLTVKLIGVLSAKQTQHGKTIRNDRLIAVPSTEVNRPRARSITDLDRDLLDEIEHFFESYNRAQGRTFRPLGRLGPQAAERLLVAALKMQADHEAEAE